ncbi:hypothetical protein B9Z65_2915 [Elsinoe australis]|uniref:Septin-type G domain-containing protein n=1 Tax=Elsinoe australis TaxID=40998 RepID=A0A2P7ZTV5_9PEZI|nr:hypothetical protein B9Z65_2915 [Elsinoe australis]
MGNDDRTLKQRVQTFRANKDSADIPPERQHLQGPSAFKLYKESELPTRLDNEDQATSEDILEAPESAAEETDSPVMADSTFGVQSLSEALENAFPDAPAEDNQSTQSSPRFKALSDMSGTSSSPSPATSRKRKANPVHPKILAAGQRIISSESKPARPKSTTSDAKPHSPAQAASTPITFQERLRTMSNTSAHTPSSVLSITPNLDPMVGLPPGSGSPRSVRLSDDDAISFDDSASQAILSSSGDEDEEELGLADTQTVPMSVGPQLVMPSVLLPARRPFTERGKQLGRMRILIAGHTEPEKTSLIHDIVETCQDIVHADAPRAVTPSMRETRCSTKPHPTWSSEVVNEARKSRRQSLDDSLLERNISFVEIAAPSENESATHGNIAIRYLEDRFRQTLGVRDLDDSELLSMFTYGGGLYPDIMLYVLEGEPTHSEQEALARLASLTNVLLVNADRDEQSSTSAPYVRSLEDALDKAQVKCISLEPTPGPLKSTNRPSTFSGDMVANLFDPQTMQKLRYAATQKLLTWRKSHPQSLAASPLLPKLSNLPSDLNLSALAPPTQTCSTISSPSGVLVPYPDSSFYRTADTVGSASPALSGHTIDSVSRANSALALATLGEPHPHSAHQENGIKEVRLAQWALDLQKSLEEERRRQTSRWTGLSAPVDCSSAANRDGSQGAVVRCGSQEGKRCGTSQEKSKRKQGRRELLCADVYDPLGILRMRQSFRRNGLPIMLRIVGIGGAIGTMALWISRNWEEVRGWFAWTGLVPEPVRESRLEYAMGWSGDVQGLRSVYEGWGLRGLVDRAVEEVGRLRPVGW